MTARASCEDARVSAPVSSRAHRLTAVMRDGERVTSLELFFDLVFVLALTQCTTLIEDGILCGYLQDKMNARLMGVRSTGNGRRESFAHMTLPRMTNTYMRAGSRSPEEIIASVDKGLYAVNFGGGQVDITSGKFVFSASEAYLIENGKIGAPVKGATLIGNGPDVLTRVSMVGNDLKLDEGVGTCGKDGQAVPVGVGIPTIKIDRLTVGGTAKKDPGGFMQ